ncbi:hypothetical protein GPROT1_03409 [Gammaproteobacteria bacterium]|nr:hypothetical protein GPROT1_03409 [Gammaproteobacteria bacterium]
MVTVCLDLDEMVFDQNPLDGACACEKALDVLRQW